MKARTLAGSFTPFAASTPLETSTPKGRTMRIASVRFFGRQPTREPQRRQAGAVDGGECIPVEGLAVPARGRGAGGRRGIHQQRREPANAAPSGRAVRCKRDGLPHGEPRVREGRHVRRRLAARAAAPSRAPPPPRCARTSSTAWSQNSPTGTGACSPKACSARVTAAAVAGSTNRGDFRTNTSPTKSAPASAHTAAVPTSRTPQILTRTSDAGVLSSR